MSRRTGFVVGMALLGVVACVLFGWAHKPVSIGGFYASADEALPLESIDVSQVAYAQLTAESPRLWLRFDLTSAEELYTSIGVPILESAEVPALWIALIGPGLPSDPLPVEFPGQGLGGRLFEASSDEMPVFFHEPFTGTDSWILFERTVELAEPGTYYLVAGSSVGDASKMWISVGRRESFGLKDLLSFPSIVRDVRAFHEVPPRAGRRLAAKVVILALAAAGMAWFVRCSP